MALAADRRAVSRRRRPEQLTRQPTVTVVVPCYNYGHYLPTTVASVLGQPGVEIELIVIDDASSDGSAEVVRKLAAADARIHPILHGHNRGHIATYNEGLEQAAGEYVVLLSADDALTPGALERATALLDAEPSVGFVYGFPAEFVDELPPAKENVRSWTVWSGREWIDRRCRTGRNCVMNPEVVIRTSVQRAIGGYDPALPHSGDLEMWLRAAAVSDVGRVNGPAQAYYRIHDQSMQRTLHAGHLIDLEGRLAAFQKVLVGPGASVPGGEELLAGAKAALAAAAVQYARSACDHGRADVEPVEAYLEFAGRVWPEVRGSRGWRAVTRSVGDRSRLEHGMGPTTRRFAEDLQGRLRWRRWRWTGV